MLSVYYIKMSKLDSSLYKFWSSLLERMRTAAFLRSTVYCYSENHRSNPLYIYLFHPLYTLSLSLFYQYFDVLAGALANISRSGTRAEFSDRLKNFQQFQHIEYIYVCVRVCVYMRTDIFLYSAQAVRSRSTHTHTPIGCASFSQPLSLCLFHSFSAFVSLQKSFFT